MALFPCSLFNIYACARYQLDGEQDVMLGAMFIDHFGQSNAEYRLHDKIHKTHHQCQAA